jgi:hypothetical protein
MIRVNDDYVIEVDALNYVPCRDCHRVDKKGIPVYKSIGYYFSLEQALKGIIRDMNNRTFAENDYSLEQAIEIIQQSNDRFTALLREVLERGSK